MAEGKKRGGYATLKQRRVLANLLANPGKPVGRAMLEEGYSPASAKNPSDLINSETFKDWNARLEHVIPDSLLVEKMREGLEATKIHSSHTEPDQEIPDHTNRREYLKLALQTRGKLQDNAAQPQVIVPIIIRQSGTGQGFTIQGDRIAPEAI